MTAVFVRIAAATAALALAPSALAAPSIVIDASSGQVIHAEQATDPWYPASLTKLMTAYVALRMVSDGRASMDTPMRVSALAARQRPSKIGLRPGSEITLGNALKILMVKSANDVAVVIAEGLGGSVPGFSALMNAEARRLGMRESRFHNPNGLHDPAMSTSARDMAILARAVLRDFPQHRDLWGIGAVQLGNRILRNTNGLIGRYSGADGMKTGFICASGFNVVATATRGGRTLIAVVLGSPSATERTALASQLFDKGFNAGGWGGFGGGAGQGEAAMLPVSAYASPTDQRYNICGAGRRSRFPLIEEEEFALPNAALSMMDNHNPVLDMLPGVVAANPSGLGSRRAMARAPRAEFVPVQVHLGRAPGSDGAPNPTALAARKPLGAPTEAAFAPAAARPPAPPVLSGKPIRLQGAADEDETPAAKGKGKKGKKVAEKPKKLAGKAKKLR